MRGGWGIIYIYIHIVPRLPGHESCSRCMCLYNSANMDCGTPTIGLEHHKQPVRLAGGRGCGDVAPCHVAPFFPFKWTYLQEISRLHLSSSWLDFTKDLGLSTLCPFWLFLLNCMCFCQRWVDPAIVQWPKTQTESFRA